MERTHSTFALFIEQEVTTLAQRRYIPNIDDGRLELTVKHSWKRLPLSFAETPEQPCGLALRIGYTGKQEADLAIYRLKPRGTGGYTITLPLLYILQDGVFVPYGS
ncbi:MAG: hypothetical protein ABI456_06145 [Ktedonobacteraceae bacterium]